MSIVSITPAIWILMNERDWILAMILDAILSGVGWAAVNLAFVTLPLEAASSSSPFAVFSALGGLDWNDRFDHRWICSTIFQLF